MLALAGLDGEYLKVRTDPAAFPDELERLKKGEWSGLNVTMPLKGSAAELADSLSPRAERAGSVNTLVRLDAGVHGESTDITAFDELVNSGRFDERSSILVLGSGGAAAAALSALDTTETTYIAARRPGRAEALSARLGGEMVSWGTGVAGALVINSTPLGMHGETLPGGVLEAASGIIDLPYGGTATPAIEQAREGDLPSADGHEFLLRQAIASFRLWTGVEIDRVHLESRLRNT